MNRSFNFFYHLFSFLIEYVILPMFLTLILFYFIVVSCIRSSSKPLYSTFHSFPTTILLNKLYPNSSRSIPPLPFFLPCKYSNSLFLPPPLLLSPHLPCCKTSLLRKTRSRQIPYPSSPSTKQSRSSPSWQLGNITHKGRRTRGKLGLEYQATRWFWYPEHVELGRG